GVHVASTGGVWSTLVGGFGGMRDHGGRLSFDPRFPEEWSGMTFRMRWHGSRLRVRLTQDSVTFAVEVGDPVEVDVRGETVRVGTRPVEVPLEGQGPRVQGGPAPHRGGESPSRRP